MPSISVSDRALVHLIGFHKHEVDLRLIDLRFEEDDAGVAGIIELLQDKTNLTLSLVARSDRATDIAAEGSCGIPILGIASTTLTGTVAMNERLGMWWPRHVARRSSVVLYRLHGSRRATER